jgi:hypothetical protein
MAGTPSKMVPGWVYSDRFEKVETVEEPSYDNDPNGCAHSLEELASGSFFYNSTATKFINEYNSLIDYLSKKGYVFATLQKLTTSDSVDGKIIKSNHLIKSGANGKKRYLVGLIYTMQSYFGDTAIMVVCKLK